MLTVGDIKADISLSLVHPLIMTSIYVAEIVMGWKLLGSTVQFLRSKPPGEQQPVDIIHCIAFHSFRNGGVISAIFIGALYLFIDTGDKIAKILMWPVYDFCVVAVCAMALDPFIQCLLPILPNMSCNISDHWLYWLGTSIIWAPLFIVTATCAPLGIYPPGYDMMRGQKVQHVGFRIGYYIGAALIVISFILDLFRGERNQFFSVTKSKAFKMTLMMLASIISIIYITLDLQGLLSIVLGFMLHNILPLMIVASNEKLLEVVKKKHPIMGMISSKIRPILCNHTHPNLQELQNHNPSSVNLEAEIADPNQLNNPNQGQSQSLDRSNAHGSVSPPQIESNVNVHAITVAPYSGKFQLKESLESQIKTPSPSSESQLSTSKQSTNHQVELEPEVIID